jgi:two-component system sensor histidine kinase EvgS
VSAIPQRRVLVVDDEPLVCDALKMMLAFEGYAVEVANSGKEALALFQKGRYDIIVTDYSMSLMRGDELALVIKAQDPAQRVVMITAYSEMLMAQGPTVPGIDYVLGKPFVLEDLRLALKTVRGGS